MLESSFIHLSGVGPKLEADLRAAGIRTWADALRMPLPCGAARSESLRAGITESQQRLDAGDAVWFGERLTPSQQWRLFPHFQDQAAYVDIETTGLSWPEAAITTIALYDGRSVRTYVQGVNLESFADDILSYKLLVTWNGRGFDAPFLRRSLCIPLDKGDMAHLDLLPVFRALGMKGGLKKVEGLLGLDRGHLDGVDGWAAVRLWQAYRRNPDPRILETLLAYNVADVLSLEALAGYAVARHARSGEQGEGAHVPIAPVAMRNPFAPCPNVLRKILGLWI